MEILHTLLAIIILFSIIGLIVTVIEIKKILLDKIDSCYEPDPPFDSVKDITADMIMTDDYFRSISFEDIFYIIENMPAEETAKLPGFTHEDKADLVLRRNAI